VRRAAILIRMRFFRAKQKIGELWKEVAATGLICLVFSGVANTLAGVSNIVVEVEASSLADHDVVKSVMQDLPAVRLRGQGVGNPQADLSIRGSSFNNAGLLLNGVTLRNAQTEHWHADLPLPAAWLRTPEVLTGLDRFRSASGHPSGSISLELSPILEDSRTATLGAGSKELLIGEWNATAVSELPGRTVGASAFLSFYDIAQTDRHSDNHLTRAETGGRLSAVSERVQGDLLTSISWREFGARGFYGTDPAYPALERLRDTLLAGSLRFTGDPQEPASISAVWRRTDDTYWLDRHKRDFYHNEHTTDFAGLHGYIRHQLSDSIFMDLRGDGDFESIRSRALGDHDRAHTSLALMPGVFFDDLLVTAGGSFDAFSDYSPVWLPAAGVEWLLLDTQSIFLSYTEAVRQPSYTELNYESPNSLGNAGLGLQKMRTAEAGYKGDSGIAMWRITFFWEKGQDVVDWIKASRNGRWTAVNLSDVTTAGLTADGRVTISGDTDLAADLLVIRKECGNKYYASRYVMDYPELDAGLTLRHRLGDGLVLMLRQGWAKFADNAFRGNDEWMIDTGIYLRWHPPKFKKIIANFGVQNLFNDDFQVYAGQMRAGRSLYGAVTYNW